MKQAEQAKYTEKITKISVLGGSGYTGQELVRLLEAHPLVEIAHIGSRSLAGTKFNQLFPASSVEIPFEDISIAQAAQSSDIIFLALPHGVAEKQLTPELLETCKIIDLSADFRLKDPRLYDQWYSFTHTSPEMLQHAVYGLPEWHKAAITHTQLLANPGCYTTASILALAPLVTKGLVEPSSIIIDAKSGVSGAGRGAKVANLFCEVADSMKPYGIANHRHTPEIEEQLGILAQASVARPDVKAATTPSAGSAPTPPTISFTPHLIPLNRGMLATCYATLKPGVSAEACLEAFQSAYQNEPFVTILDPGTLPQTRWVRGTNHCHISLTHDPRTNRVIVVSAIDNLLKGASGQAVQNMNLMCGYPETLGLEQTALIPG